MTLNSFSIITFGCQMNVNDSERIAGLLENLKLKRTKNKFRADLVVINTCGVRQSPEDRVYGIVPIIKKKNPAAAIVVTGCIAHRSDVQRRLQKYTSYFVPTPKLPAYLKKLLSKPGGALKSQRRAPTKKAFFKISPRYSSSFSAYLPIMTGCNNFCSYCVVPYARGRETSRPPRKIIQEAKALIKKGYKEIVLLGQNVNSYNPNPSAQKITDFPELLQALANIPGNFWLRFFTSHPKDMSEKLIKTIAGSKKITNYIHLPFQAGSDKILKKMNRRYTQKRYLSLLKKIRAQIPDAAITTDVIVGFPTETLKDFQETKKVMQAGRFDMAYISQYSPRPQTAAYKLKDTVPKPEKKRRKKVLTQILEKTALKNNQKYIGKKVTVLLEAKKSHPKSKTPVYLGKIAAFKMVKIKAGSQKPLKIGQFYSVKIKKAFDFGLEGEVIKKKKAFHERH